jgi:uncharacterized membrane protein
MVLYILIFMVFFFFFFLGADRKTRDSEENVKESTYS